jgi:hypothetical protein
MRWKEIVNEDVMDNLAKEEKKHKDFIEKPKYLK